MESTNFEFIRDRWPKLADDAASAERDVHGNPRGALRHVRSICEKFIRIRFDDWDKYKSFEQLLQCHGSKLQDEALFALIHRLRKDANDALHLGRDPIELSTTDAIKHLRTAFDFARAVFSFVTGDEHEGEFVAPPPGGERFAKVKRDRDEAMREVIRQPLNLSGWIDVASTSPFKAPENDSFSERPALTRKILERLEARQKRILLVGEPGRGKTRLLKELLNQRVFRIDDDDRVLSYFFVSSSQPSKVGWVRHLYATLLKEFGLDECDRAVRDAGEDELFNRLCIRLREICSPDESPRLILVIDAIDEAGDAYGSVLNFIKRGLQGLPDNVSIVATVRPGHISADSSNINQEDLVNLEDVDLLNTHRVDGQNYVRDRLSESEIPEELIKEIARVGDGNFQAMRHICNRIPDLESQDKIPVYLKSITSGSDVLTAVYEEWWDRLENQLDPDRQDTLISIAAIISTAQVPLSLKFIKRLRKLSRADEKAFEKHLSEYLRLSTVTSPDENDAGTDRDEHPVEVYRFYHATFASFFRRRFPEAIVDATNLLATCCLGTVEVFRKSSHLTWMSSRGRAILGLDAEIEAGLGSWMRWGRRIDGLSRWWSGSSGRSFNRRWMT